MAEYHSAITRLSDICRSRSVCYEVYWNVLTCNLICRCTYLQQPKRKILYEKWFRM